MSDTPASFNPGRKAVRTLVFAAAGLAALLIGYIVARADPEGPVHLSALDGAFWTVWIAMGVFAGGVVGELIGMRVGRK